MPLPVTFPLFSLKFAEKSGLSSLFYLYVQLQCHFDVFKLLSLYIYVSPADGDKNGSAPAKSDKKFALILMNYFLVASCITVLHELLPCELVA